MNIYKSGDRVNTIYGEVMIIRHIQLLTMDMYYVRNNNGIFNYIDDNEIYDKKNVYERKPLDLGRE